MLYLSLVNLHIMKLYIAYYETLCLEKVVSFGEPTTLNISWVSSTKGTIQLSFFYFSIIQTWGICTGAIGITLDNYLLINTYKLHCEYNPFGSSWKDLSIKPICQSLQTHTETISFYWCIKLIVSWNKRLIKWI